MSVSRWIIAVTFGLIASLLQAQEQTSNRPTGATSESHPSQSNTFGIPVRIVEDPIAAESRERRESEAAQREKDDLVAQQGMNAATQAMNEATQSMNRAAWWSFGAIAIGTMLLIWTLFLTRQANRAAQAAVDATREIGEAQVRAYVSFEFDDLRCDDAGVGRDGDPRVKIVLRGRLVNSGQSPAIQTSTSFFIGISGHQHEHKITGDEFFDAGQRATFIQSGGGVHQELSRTMSGSIDLIASGKKFPYFIIAIEYTDVFGERVTPAIISGHIEKICGPVDGRKVIWASFTPPDKRANKR